MRILIKAVAGSHLFGTNTPESDKDYKGVFVPSREEILLGNYKESVSQSTGSSGTKNNKEDIDVELYSLKKFLKMLKNGDTAALELLFTPDQFILEKDPMWDEIVKNREKLLSSDVTAMIGYARQQANKYGIKGSRMGELANFIELLKSIQSKFNFPNPKLKHGWEDILNGIKGYSHIYTYDQKIKAKEETTFPAVNVLGKMFDHHCNFIYVLEILKKMYKEYGHRAREAKSNNGIDWKALSHAVRVCLQGIELLETGKITLPLRKEDLDLVMSIKSKQIDFDKTGSIIGEKLSRLEMSKKKMVIPMKIDDDYINSYLISVHERIVMDK